MALVLCRFGRPGCESQIVQLPDEPAAHEAVLFLFVLPPSPGGGAQLLGVTEHGVKQWSLDALKLARHRSTPTGTARITSAALSQSQQMAKRFLFLGCADGQVLVLDTDKFTWSQYSIPKPAFVRKQAPSPQSQAQQQQQQQPSGAAASDESGVAVTGVQEASDPTLQQLLIAYQSGDIISWHLSKQALHRQYDRLALSGSPPPPSAASASAPATATSGCAIPTAIAWEPSCERFAAGFDNGEIAIWKRKTGQPVQRLFGERVVAVRVSLLSHTLSFAVSNQGPRSPISILKWIG